MKLPLQYAIILSQKFLNIDDDIIPEIEMCLEREGDKVSIPLDIEFFGLIINNSDGNGSGHNNRNGNGYGNGYEYGKDNGSGYDYAYGNGYCDGYRYGNGYGYGYNNGDGNGDGDDETGRRL